MCKNKNLLILCIIFSTYFISCTDVADKESEIASLRNDVIFLSDDALEGREIGSEGEKSAAKYISNRFNELGILPKGTDGYIQEFGFSPMKNPHDTSEKDNTAKVYGQNVVGYIDNGASTTVVLGAHYDHLGYGDASSLHRGDSAIHNGADDNASGVAALLLLAQKMKARNLNNNYLIIAFSGEEKGLFGSNYYTKNPTIELENLNYMINMDMVGRLNEEKALAINGVGTSPKWTTHVEEIQVDSIKVITSESGIGPSDHTSFYLKDIPVLHFFTGQHEDYHKPSDDADKINYEGLYSVTVYIDSLITRLDYEGKLEFTKTKDESKDTPRFTVTLGVVPDYLFDGQGMRIDGVSEDKPAQKAGLETGDVVIKLGEIEVTDMMSYMKALAEFKKGDTSTVTVQRGNEKLSYTIQF